MALARGTPWIRRPDESTIFVVIAGTPMPRAARAAGLARPAPVIALVLAAGGGSSTLTTLAVTVGAIIATLLVVAAATAA